MKKILFRASALFICGLLILAAFVSPARAVSYNTSSDYITSVYCTRLNDVVLTGDGRVDIVNVALSQYGYSESDNPWNLTGMHFGMGNYTEYGHWYGVQSLWCAMFVSWCAHNAGISTQVVPSHAYTPSGVLWFMDRGQAHSRSSVESGEYIPQPGDIIYFRSDRNDSIVNHVGIVIGYFDGFVYTVEGNVNFDPSCTDGGQVLVRNRHISDENIRYICSPSYKGESIHEVGAFFPEEDHPVEIEDAVVTLPEDADAIIPVPGSSTDLPSTNPQYSFIP